MPGFERVRCREEFMTVKAWRQAPCDVWVQEGNFSTPRVASVQQFSPCCDMLPPVSPVLSSRR